MAYDPKAIEIGTNPAGIRVEGAIIRIVEGKTKDFFTPEQLAKFDDCNPEASVINVVMEYLYEGTPFTRDKTIALPFNNKAHPKSMMAKWKKQYGDFPTVGQKVTLVTNEKGYFEVLC